MLLTSPFCFDFSGQHTANDDVLKDRALKPIVSAAHTSFYLKAH